MAVNGREMPSLLPLRVLERSQVSPPPGTVPESSLQLTFFDVAWLYSGPVERVFFYRLTESTSHFVHATLPVLKSSLSLALQQFYPLAGKIRRAPESNKSYEIHYADGDPVSFLAVEMEHEGDDFVDLCGNHARDIRRLLQLLPELPRCQDAQPVLALQVTLFPNQGVAIGVVVHHAAADGSSFMHFVSSWALSCRTAGLAPVVAPAPSFERTVVITQLRDLYLSTVDNVMSIAQIDKVQIPTSCTGVSATFTLGEEHIAKLKALLTAKAAEAGTPLHCSTVVVTYAFVWVCIGKTRGHAGDRAAHMVFMADCRGALRPPLPSAYFGSCVGPCFVEVKSGDLVGEDGFMEAAREIGDCIKMFREDAMGSAGTWIERAGGLIVEQPFSVAGSPRFRSYDVDFGWGKPSKVEVTSIARTGAMSLTESKDGKGVEIGLVLPQEKMEQFSAHFSNGIKFLVHG